MRTPPVHLGGQQCHPLSNSVPFVFLHVRSALLGPCIQVFHRLPSRDSVRLCTKSLGSDFNGAHSTPRGVVAAVEHGKG